jgi:hypothetical protein
LLDVHEALELPRRVVDTGGGAMRKKSFSIPLDETTRLHLFLSRERSVVASFVVKLESFRDGRWAEVQRYDTHHACVHKDVLTRAGKKRRIIRYNYLDGSTGFTASIQDFKENYETYIWRWEHGDQGSKNDSR